MNPADRFLPRLAFVYGDETARRVLPRLEEILSRHRARIPPRPAGWSEKDALLIAYADSILSPGQPPLRTLHNFIQARVGNLLSFVHLLPFYGHDRHPRHLHPQSARVPQ